MKLGLWIAPTNVASTSQLFRDHPEWLMRNADGQPASIGRWFWVPNPEMSLIDASQPGAERWIEETFARLTSEGARYYKIDFIAGSPALRRAMAAIRRGAGPEAWIRYCQTPPWRPADEQIGPLFLPKAAELVNEDGLVAMIQPASSLLFNVSPTALQAWERLFLASRSWKTNDYGSSAQGLRHVPSFLPIGTPSSTSRASCS